MAVMSLCNFLVRQGVLAPAIKEPMKSHKPKRLLSPRRTSLYSLAEVNRFIDGLWLTEDYSAYEKTLNTGIVGVMAFAWLRISEVANLELADLDVNGRVLHVRCGKGDRLTIRAFLAGHRHCIGG